MDKGFSGYGSVGWRSLGHGRNFLLGHDMEHTESKDHLGSLARGLDVIVAMGRHDSLTLAELARITGFNRFLVRRIILTLESLGYVGREGRSIRLLPKVLDLGYAYMFSMDLWKIADPLIMELVDRVQLNCSLSVLEGNDIVYIARRIASNSAIRLPLQVGSRVPAHCTASGRVLLTEKTEGDLDAWLAANPLHAMTPGTETDPARLKALVREVRQQGWCRADHELAEGSCAIAMPVRDRLGKVLAAISLSGHEGELAPPAIAVALRDAVTRIESVLHRR